jgi:hypothetical protein
MKHKVDIRKRIELHKSEIMVLRAENPIYARLEYDKASPIEAFEFWNYSIQINAIEQKIKVLQWILI